jgi:hypothetical protein
VVLSRFRASYGCDGSAAEWRARRITESIAIKKPSLSSPLPTDSPVASPGSLASTPPASPSLASPSCKRVFLKKKCIFKHFLPCFRDYICLGNNLLPPSSPSTWLSFVLDVTALGVLSMSCSLKGEGECLAYCIPSWKQQTSDEAPGIRQVWQSTAKFPECVWLVSALDSCFETFFICITDCVSRLSRGAVQDLLPSIKSVK